MKNFKEQLNLMKSPFVLQIALCITTLFFLTGSPYGQDPLRFAADVEIIKSTQVDQTRSLIVFTGSSSIRMWSDLKDRFPSHQVVNSGFGGSQFSDLIHYVQELILGFNPVQVFVYEGDNDLAAGKSIMEVSKDARQLVRIITNHNHECEIILISPKPSLARWNLKERYQTLSEELRKFADSENGVKFADVWTPMLGPDGVVKADIFLEDGLHMNQKGYDIWYQVLKPFLR